MLSIDFSPVAQAKARTLAQDRDVSVQFELVDLDRFAWPEAAFDLIVDIFTQFSNPQARKRKFAGERYALKPGGLLLIEGYRPEQIAYATGGPSQPENLYTHALLAEEFADFKNVRIESHDIELAEGTAHAGMSAIIDFVGWKPA